MLLDGQKKGPYGLSAIKALLDKKEILITDEISIDGGLSWQKLFSLNEFDRRQREESPKLPFVPKEQAKETTASGIPSKQREDNSEMADLVQIALGESLQTQKYQGPGPSDEQDQLHRPQKAAPSRFKMLGVAAMSLVFAFTLFSRFKGPSPDRESVETELPTAAQKIPKATSPPQNIAPTRVPAQNKKRLFRPPPKRPKAPRLPPKRTTPPPRREEVIEREEDPPAEREEEDEEAQSEEKGKNAQRKKERSREDDEEEEEVEEEEVSEASEELEEEPLPPEEEEDEEAGPY